MPERLDSPTDLLLAWGRGDGSAFDRLVPLVHDELRRLARRHMRRERPDHTLQATALVNEVYLRMIATRHVPWQSRVHFFAIAARVMRQILVDAARSRRASQRGGTVQRVSLDEAFVPSAVRSPDLVALDEALKRLESVHPRKSQVVELRYFGGLKLEEAATRNELERFAPDVPHPDVAIGAVDVQRHAQAVGRDAGKEVVARGGAQILFPPVAIHPDQRAELRSIVASIDQCALARHVKARGTAVGDECRSPRVSSRAASNGIVLIASPEP